MSSEQIHIMQGIPASAGIAIGHAVIIDTRKIERYPKIRITEEIIEDEITRFDKAVEISCTQVNNAIKKLGSHTGIREHSLILESHLMMLKDPSLLERVNTLIRSRLINAEWALKVSLQEIEISFESIEDEYIKSRVADTSFVGERLMRNLVGKEAGSFHLHEKSIVVAHDLSPADTAMLNKDKVLGFATDMGGRTSHTAIIAHSLEMPAVVGLEKATLAINPGDRLILDGITGTLIINPSDPQVEEYRQRTEAYLSLENRLRERAKLPAITKDNKTIKVKGNLEFKEEVNSVLEHGAEGIGLYRTEFLYLNRRIPPSEEDHFEAYKSVIEAVSPFNTTIRTLDVGGDKFHASRKEITKEANPALGLRAIRFCLKETQIFKTQLRGILRASHYGRASIMFPMISGMEEILRAKEILEEVKQELSKEGIPFDKEIPVGIMIEIPSAAIIADLLAKEVDFFSIGTNDLIQYSLAIDRGNEYVNYLYEPLHPSVLRLIKHTIDAGHSQGIEVAMCGEMAGREIYTPILLGLGIDILSTNIFALPHIKEIIRKINISKCSGIIDHLFYLKTAKEVYDFMHNELEKHAPDIIR